VNCSDKITPRASRAVGVIYIPPVDLAQVRDHTESTARQYALAEAAARLGWEPARIVVIDADLGVSGRTAAPGRGFKELVGACVSAKWARSLGSKYRAWPAVARTSSACSSCAV